MVNNPEIWMQYLASRDEKLKALINYFGVIKLDSRKPKFEDFCRIIVSQQLSNAAADTIFSRIKQLETQGNCLQSATITETDPHQLRKCGVSTAKAAYIQAAAARLIDDPNLLDRITNLSDEDTFNELLSFKGIGPWSAQIFQLSVLGRENIFPSGDATLARAIERLYGLDINIDALTYSKMLKIWSPYKSFVAKYLWAWIDHGEPKI